MKIQFNFCGKTEYVTSVGKYGCKTDSDINKAKVYKTRAEANKDMYYLEELTKDNFKWDYEFKVVPNSLKSENTKHIF